MRYGRFENFVFDGYGFSENIKQARKGRGLTQAQVAKILSVSKGTVSLWESGKVQPTADNIIALCWLYDFNPVVFLVVRTDDALKTKRMFDDCVGSKPIAAFAEALGDSPYIPEGVGQDA